MPVIALVVEKIAKTVSVVIAVPVEPALAGGALVDVALAVGHHRDHAGHPRVRRDDAIQDGICRRLESCSSSVLPM